MCDVVLYVRLDKWEVYRFIMSRRDKIGISCKISNEMYKKHYNFQLKENNLEQCRNKKLHDNQIR